MDTAPLYELDFAEWARQNAYDDAVVIVTKLTGRAWENFPPVCPYTFEQPQGAPFLPCTQR